MSSLCLPRMRCRYGSYLPGECLDCGIPCFMKWESIILFASLSAHVYLLRRIYRRRYPAIDEPICHLLSNTYIMSQPQYLGPERQANSLSSSHKITARLYYNLNGCMISRSRGYYKQLNTWWLGSLASWDHISPVRREKTRSSLEKRVRPMVWSL